MIVKVNESKTLQASNCTVDGIMINILMTATATNTAMSALTDFLSAQVNAKAQLQRGNSQIMILQDNLRTLGEFSSQSYDNASWYQGNYQVLPAVGVKALKLVTLWMPFGGPINLKGNDMLTTEFIVNANVWSANVDGGVSSIEFNYRVTKGAEFGIPRIQSRVVQANIDKETYPLGDFVTKIMMSNFDQTDISTPVIQNISLQSTQIQQTYNFYDCFNLHHNLNLPPSLNRRYVTGAGAEALPSLPFYPQSLVIYSTMEGKHIDGVSLSNAYNGALVAASQNYVTWLSFIVTKNTLANGNKVTAQHQAHATSIAAPSVAASA